MNLVQTLSGVLVFQENRVIPFPVLDFIERIIRISIVIIFHIKCVYSHSRILRVNLKEQIILTLILPLQNLGLIFIFLLLLLRFQLARNAVNLIDQPLSARHIVEGILTGKVILGRISFFLQS